MTKCSCCTFDEAHYVRMHNGKQLPMCGACKDSALDWPRRDDALGECQSWFYGYKLPDGTRYIMPNTPAAH